CVRLLRDRGSKLRKGGQSLRDRTSGTRPREQTAERWSIAPRSNEPNPTGGAVGDNAVGDTAASESAGRLQPAEPVLGHRIGDFDIELIDPRERFGVEDQIGCGERFFELRERSCSKNR